MPQATIATAALVELGVIAADETPSASDQALALDKVASVHGSLLAQGIALWDVSAIPRAFAEEYTKLTAAMAASQLRQGGRSGDRGAARGPYSCRRHGDERRYAVRARQGDLRPCQRWMRRAWCGGPATAVPRAFTEEYMKLTVAMTAGSLGKQIDPAIIPALEARVRKGAMVLSADDNANQAVQAVHDDLVMRGIARWSVFDIPDAASTSYVTLAADALGPLFGVQTDPKDAAMAMVALYRYVALPTSGETVAAAYF